MTSQYNLIILGPGPGGYVAPIQGSQKNGQAKSKEPTT